MALIYPKSNSGYGELVGELVALGGVEGTDFRFAHDRVHNVVAEATEELYDAWRASTQAQPDESGESKSDGAADSTGDTAAARGAETAEDPADKPAETSDAADKAAAKKPAANTRK